MHIVRDLGCILSDHIRTRICTANLMCRGLLFTWKLVLCQRARSSAHHSSACRFPPTVVQWDNTQSTPGVTQTQGPQQLTPRCMPRTSSWCKLSGQLGNKVEVWSWTHKGSWKIKFFSYLCHISW